MQKNSAGRPMRLLHLEDNENDHLLVIETLRADGLDCDVTLAKTKEEFSNALRGDKFDLIISDYTLPSYDGLTALSMARELRPEIPFIFFSGTIGEDVAVDSLKHGAVDYVLKQRPHRLTPAVNRALRNAREHARLRQTEEKIREQIEFLDKAQDAIFVLDLDARVIYWNKSAERIYGWSAEEAIGKSPVDLLFKGAMTPELEELIKAVNERGEWIGELHETAKNGKPIIVQGRCNLIRDAQGRPKSRLIINTDITERKHLEEQFFRAQRLESLGMLVSGIAHDLNNALVPILVGVDILREQSPPENARPILQMMETSARRSADMVKQMLMFVRGGESSKTLIHADQLIKEISKIIAATFPKSIRCRTRIEKNSPPVLGILTQMHQVLMNLCVNARDAMAAGGTLTLVAENARFDAAAAARSPGAKPGNYLCISVADTGAGISAEQMEKIFEPLFTTKSPGKGTGLGLSTSLTIVKNHGGFMKVDSEVGHGATFQIFLPAAIVTTAEKAAPLKPAPPVGNGETVLVVDDEEAMLALTRTALENYGYRVLTAASGSEAVVRFSENQDAVRLVITDLDMPFMDGSATIDALRNISPDVKIIIASGSEQESVVTGQRGIKINAFIEKPFTTEKLLTTVHRILSSGPT